MRTLQRYILSELTRVLLLITCVLTVLLVFVGVFREMSESGLGPLQALQILPYVVPSLLPFTIPATLLLAVCVVYGRLAADFEITAAKAAGINVLSLLFPAFFLGAILTVCSLLLNDQVIPWSVGRIQHVVSLAMEDIFFDVLASQNQIQDGEHGVSITVERVDLEQRRLIRPVIRFAPRGGEPLIIQARDATLRFDLEQQQVLLKLVEAYVDAPGQMSMRFLEKEFPFPLTVGGNRIKPRHLTIIEIERRLEEIRREIQNAEERQAVETAFALSIGEFDTFQQSRFQQHAYRIRGSRDQSMGHHTELHTRFSLSCSCFFFALVGGPFSILQARRQFLTTFFLCFLPILLVYYPVVLLMMNLSRTGSVNPAWSMWIGNIILLVTSIFCLRQAVKH